MKLIRYGELETVRQALLDSAMPLLM